MKNKFNHKKALFLSLLVGIFAIVPCFTVFADCQNECSYAGQIGFADSGIQKRLERVCGNYDSDDCLEWSAWKYGHTNSACGDGQCDTSAGENTYNCPGDCGQPMIYDCFNCGDGQCDSSCGENSYTCSKDCSGSNGTSGTLKTSILKILQTGRNSARGEISWSETTSAYPGDAMQFRITVTNTGSSIIKNITIKDTLAANFGYSGGMTVDGVSKSDSIVAGTNIGDLLIGQTRTIIFDTTVAPAGSFGYGRTSLVNYATVSGDNSLQASDSIETGVDKTQVLGTVTEISTGAGSWIFAIYPSIIIAIVFTMICIFNRYLIPRNKTWRKIMDKVSLLKLYIFSN